MKVKVRLFASLEPYLPPGAAQNQAEVDVPDGATARDIVAALGLPFEMCHRILVNGHNLDAEDRDSLPLRGADTLAIWPTSRTR